MSPLPRPKPPMKFAKLALIATATAAAAIAIPATAQADPDYSDNQIFQSPSGNIRCNVSYTVKANPHADCTIQHSTYAAPPGCEYLPWAQFELGQGESPNLSCVVGFRNPGAYPTLDYGQKTRSFGAISCDSEPSGITCTDSGTGHFFRMSRESYQLG